MTKRQAHYQAMKVAYSVLQSQDAIGVAAGASWSEEDETKVAEAFDAIVQSLYSRMKRLEETNGQIR